jgi:hypothetical protein
MVGDGVMVGVIFVRVKGRRGRVRMFCGRLLVVSMGGVC